MTTSAPEPGERGLDPAAEVSTWMDSSPDVVYRLVSDVTRMGEWSPECSRCEWLDTAQEPEVGARFRAWNKRGLMRWRNTPTVVAATPGEVFAFERTNGPGAGRVRWTYRLEPRDGGTLVAEAYEITEPISPLIGRFMGLMLRVSDRTSDLTDGMKETLERVKAAAER